MQILTVYVRCRYTLFFFLFTFLMLHCFGRKCKQWINEISKNQTLMNYYEKVIESEQCVACVWRTVPQKAISRCTVLTHGRFTCWTGFFISTTNWWLIKLTIKLLFRLRVSACLDIKWWQTTIVQLQRAQSPSCREKDCILWTLTKRDRHRAKWKNRGWIMNLMWNLEMNQEWSMIKGDGQKNQ